MKVTQDYFKDEEQRDPTETELKVLDTYWSDHCRHTTFTTGLEEITIDESFMKAEMEESLALYENMRKQSNARWQPTELLFKEKWQAFLNASRKVDSETYFAI